MSAHQNLVQGSKRSAQSTSKFSVGIEQQHPSNLIVALTSLIQKYGSPI